MRHSAAPWARRLAVATVLAAIIGTGLSLALPTTASAARHNPIPADASGDPIRSVLDNQSLWASARILNPAGGARSFNRISRPRSAVKALKFAADVNRDGKITRRDATRSVVAKRLLRAADRAPSRGGRNRLTERELVRFASRKAGRNGRFSQRELDRMLNELRVPRAPQDPGPGPATGPGSGSAPQPQPQPPARPSPPSPPSPPAPPPPPPPPPPDFEPYPLATAQAAVWNKSNTDGNDVIDMADRDRMPLLGLMGVQSATRAEVNAFVAQRYDTNHNGIMEAAEDAWLREEFFSFEPYPLATAQASVWNYFNTDGNDVIDMADWGDGLPLLELMGAESATRAEVNAFVAQRYDTNHNGIMEEAENAAYAEELLSQPLFEPYPLASAQDTVWNVFNTDNNDVVDGDDYNAGEPLLSLMGVQSATRAQVDSFVAARYDANGSSRIEYAEHQRIETELIGG